MFSEYCVLFANTPIYKLMEKHVLILLGQHRIMYYYKKVEKGQIDSYKQ